MASTKNACAAFSRDSSEAWANESENEIAVAKSSEMGPMARCLFICGPSQMDRKSLRASSSASSNALLALWPMLLHLRSKLRMSWAPRKRSPQQRLSGRRHNRVLIAMADGAGCSAGAGDLFVTSAMATATPSSIAPHASNIAATGIRRRFNPDAVLTLPIPNRELWTVISFMRSRKPPIGAGIPADDDDEASAEEALGNAGPTRSGACCRSGEASGSGVRDAEMPLICGTTTGFDDDKRIVMGAFKRRTIRSTACAPPGPPNGSSAFAK